MFPHPCRVLTGLVLPLLVFTLAATAWAVPPINDNFSNPTVLSTANFYGAVVGSNQEATAEGFESPGAGQASVWFRWTATIADTLTFSTLGSNFGTTLAVYESPPTGGSVATPAYIGASTPEEAALPAPWNGACEVTFAAQANKAYYIAVNGTVLPGPGARSAQGKILLSWHSASPSSWAPVNDGIILPSPASTYAGRERLACKCLCSIC